MTISDFIERLKRLQSEMGTSVQVQIGKQYNNAQERFEFFEVIKSDKDIVLVPTDKWDRKDRVQ